MNDEDSQRFANAARAYCTFVDEIDHAAPKELFLRLEILLTDLLSSVASLEAGEGTRFADDDRHDIDHDQWRIRSARIADALGDGPDRLADHLAELADAGPESEDSIRARFLWDDLADIDRDLRVGLAWWKESTDDALSEACWRWRFNYENHWGYHAIRALYTVHQALYLIKID